MKYKNISIKSLLSTGPDEHSINFHNSHMLGNFLGRSNTYGSQSIRKKRYIITDTSKNYYVIVSYNGNDVNTYKELQKFYDTHVWQNGIVSEVRILAMPTKEQIQKNNIRHVKVGKLLSLIQARYGDLVKAEGTQEFLELQKLLNVARS